MNKRTQRLRYLTLATASALALQAGAVEARATQDLAVSSPQASDATRPIPPAIRVMIPEEKVEYDSWIEAAYTATTERRYDDARTLLDQILMREEQTFGPDHPEVAGTLAWIAFNLNAQGRYSEAQPLFERALRITEAASGPDHPDTATSLNNLAGNLNTQGRYSEAQPLLERALRIREVALGPDHPTTAISLNNLAGNLDIQGRYSEAQPLFERALRINEAAFGPDHPDTATSLNNLALNLNGEGRYSEAQPLYERALRIRETALGPDHPDTATSLNNLAGNLNAQGRYSEAQPLYERALRINEAALGPDHPNTATSLNSLAFNLNGQGRYGEALSLFERALMIREAALGPDHPATATSFNNFASNLNAQGRYSEAQPLFERALRIREAALGLDHLDTATSLNNLAENLNAQGRYSEAQQLFERALRITEAALGPDHPSTATNLGNLAGNLNAQGRYSEAQRLFERALRITEAALGPDHPTTARSLGNLAGNLNEQGRYSEAQPLYERALRINEAGLGPDHPTTATSLNNLASNINAQGRYLDAQPLYQRALRITEAALGPDHPSTATSLNNLAGNLNEQGRYSEAQPLYERALRINEAGLGPDHPDTATSLNNLAANFDSQGRYSKAQPRYKRALRIREAALGPDHPTTATSLNNVAFNLNAQGRYSKAQPLFERALRITEAALGPDHPSTALSAQNSASAGLRSGDASSALAPARQALAIRTRVALREGETGAEGIQTRLAGQTANAAVIFTRAAWTTRASADGGEAALRAEAFEALQQQGSSSAGRAQVRAAARDGLTPAGQGLAREWEAALEQRAALDQRFSAAAGGTGEDARALQAELTEERDQLDATISGLTADLQRDHPQYLVLLNPEPLSVAAVQSLLHPDEALVLVSPGEVRFPEGQRRGIVFVVTREGVDWAEVGMEPAELQARITALREQLSSAAGGRGPDSQPGDDGALGQGGRGFDRTKAFELYQALFGDERIAGLLQGKTDWILSPQGSLLSLPFAALPTAAPVGDDADAAVLAATPWLGTTRALSVLPNLSALAQVRGTDPETRQTAPEAFRGFGYATYNRGTPSVAAEGSFLTQAQLRANGVRTLSALPNTDDELLKIAATFGDAEGRTLAFEGDATEAAVKAMSEDGSLYRARVIVFATHGLIPKQLGLDQAALAFTPPDNPQGDDDGLLTAAEAAGLRLNADWVILSACDTASSDQDAGSEALAGLARAFFFAGARSLLVSHWQVGDQDAATLTSTAVRLQQDQDLSRARALQQSMQQVLANPKTAHPTHWAPFILVGAE